MLLETIKFATMKGATGSITEAEVGLVCGVEVVPFVVRHLHGQILRQLKASAIDGGLN